MVYYTINLEGIDEDIQCMVEIMAEIDDNFEGDETAKEFRQVLQYFCCKWSKGECNYVINGPDFDPGKWKYSLGDHLWKKWEEARDNHNGSLDCITWYILECMDNENLQKVINRTVELCK